MYYHCNDAVLRGKVKYFNLGQVLKVLKFTCVSSALVLNVGAININIGSSCLNGLYNL